MSLAESRAALASASSEAEAAVGQLTGIKQTLESAQASANAAAQDFDASDLTEAVAQLGDAAGKVDDLMGQVSHAKDGLDGYVQRMS